MSDGDETRVLNMRINNKQFLSGASDSLKALDTLNKGIDGAGKGPGMQNLGKSVETVKTKFGALQVAGITALSNITNRAVNAGLRLVKSFTIQPILDGFHEYEKLLTATQTIAANTNNNNAKGIAKVGTYLDALNHYSDLTIYNFGQMADNLGRFTAAGVKLDTATTAIKGLSNAAALAGSTNEQLGTAMYQVSQALATGTIKLMDWNSLSNAGLGGKNLQKSFRLAAASISGSTSTVDAAIKKYGSFRESLRSGWLTADVFTKSMKVFAGQTLDTTSKTKDLQRLGLDKLTISAIKAGRAFKFTGDDVKSLAKDGFSKADIGALQLGNTVGFTVKQLQQLGYSKEAAKTLSQLAKDAQDSATKVKTFSQLMGVVKEAVGSGFAGVFRQLFGNLEESSKLWTAVSNVITGAIAKIFNAMALLLNGWHNTEVVFDSGRKINGYHLIWKAFGHTMQTVGNILKPFFKVFAGFLPSTESGGNALLSFSKALFLFSVAIDHATSKGGTFAPTIQVLAEVFKIIISIIGGVIKSFIGLVQIFAPVAAALIRLAAAVGGLISKLLLMVHIGGGIGGLFDKLLDVRKAILEPIVRILVDMIDALTALVNGDISGFKSKLKDAFGEISNIGDFFKSGFDIAKNLIAGLVSGLNAGTIKAAIGRVVNDMIDFFKGLLGIHSPSTVFEGFGKNIIEGLIKGIVGAASALIGLIKGLVGGIGSSLGGIDKFDLANIFSILFSASVFLTVRSFLKTFNNIMKNFSNIGQSANGVLKQTTSNLKTMQTGVRAKALLDIASAVGVLAGALFILSKIPEAKLKTGLAAIVVLLGSLTGALFLLSKIGPVASLLLPGLAISMVGVAVAMVILAGALTLLGKVIQQYAKMKWSEIAKGLGMITLVLLAVGVGMTLLSAQAPMMLIASVALLVLVAGLTALLGVITLFAQVDWATIISGVGKIAVTLLALGVAMAPLSLMAPLLLVASAALIVLSVALTAMLGVIGIFAATDWGTIISGVAKISIALIALGAAGLIAAPGLILLGVAAALIGGGLLAAGVGMTLFAAGLVAVGVAGAAAGAVLAAAFEAFLALLPVMAVQVVAGLLAFLQALADASPKIVAALVKIGTELLKGIARLGKPLVAALIVLLDDLLAGIVKWTPHLIKAGVDLIIALIQGIGDSAEQLVVAAAETLLKFLNALDDAINTYEPQILATGQRIGFDLIKGLVVGLVPKPILDAFTSLVTTIVNFFKNLLGINSPSTVFAGFGRNIVEGLANGIGAAISLVTGIIGKLVKGAVNIVSKLPGQARSALSGFGGILKSVFGGAFKAASSAVSNGVKNIGDAVSKIPGIIRGAIGAVASAASDLGHSIISGIGKGLAKTGNFIANLASGLKSAINGALGLPRDIKIGKKIAGHFVGGTLHIPGFARGTDNAPGGTALVGENGAELVTTGRGASVITNKNLVAFMRAVNALTRKLTSGVQTQNSPGGNIVYKVSAGFQGDPKASGVAFAANLAAGLINGMQANQGSINSTMADSGTKLSQAFADILGIASPSKVFHKYAGYVSKGFINGLLASVASVKAAAVTMAKAATDVVSKTITDSQLKLEAVQARTDAYSQAAALLRQKIKHDKLTKAEKKHLEAMAKLYDKESKAAQKAADAQQKKVDAENEKAQRALDYANADTQGKADMKNEDALTAAQHASLDRQKALQFAKEADLIRKTDKKKAAELDALAKKWLGYAQTWSSRAEAAAQQASVLSDQAKVEQAAADAAENAASVADAAKQISSVSAEDVIKAQNMFDAYAKSLLDASDAAAQDTPPNEVTLIQNNTSPEAISPAEAYRNGKSLVSVMERKLLPVP